MTALTTEQIDTLATQGDAIDETFVNIAALLKDKALDRNIRKRLVKIATMLNRASDMLSDLTEDEDDPKAAKVRDQKAQARIDAKVKKPKAPKKPKAAAARAPRGSVKRSR